MSEHWNRAHLVGAFGITNDPEELIHLLLDALARTRY